ncbi:MAG TPA: hypothetical protein PKI03_00345 [Pseudomonadota bacterium]|nr:hypothetical protein [Pseudomonadota bacterium]
MSKTRAVMGWVLALSACTNAEPAGPSALSIKAQGADIQGTFRSGEAGVTFASREVEAKVFDILVDVNGMTLSALVDANHQVAELDGFASTGGDTQMLEADRAVLKDLVLALDGAEELAKDGVTASAMLYRVVSNWSQATETVPMQRQVAGSEQRGWTSLCSSFGKYVKATHNCNLYARNAANSTSSAKVGTRTASTYYYVGGRWTTTTPNHGANLSEYGACFGNCGPSCPSGDQTLTLDCHDHDQCVRNGHSLTSAYCNDEFASASDDEFFAPRCTGT